MNRKTDSSIFERLIEHCKKNDRLTIPEIGVELVVHNPLHTMLLLNPIINKSKATCFKLFEENNTTIRQSRIENAINIIRVSHDLNLTKVIIMGETLDESWPLFYKKYKAHIYEDSHFKYTMESDHVACYIRNKDLDENDLRALAKTGVTIAAINLLGHGIYAKSDYFWTYNPYLFPMLFLKEAEGYGLSFHEYIIVLIMYDIEQKDINIKKQLMKICDSAFIASWAQAHKEFHTEKTLNPLVRSKSSLSDRIIHMVRVLGLEAIKKWPLDFIERYLVE